jgi:predicted Zn-dependent peptidase
MTAAALVLAALVSQNPAAQAPKESPPPPAPAPDLRLPETRELTLDNGLAVTLVQVGRTPKATVQLVFRVGTGDDAEAKTGLSSFVASLLPEGTATRSAAEIAAAAARWGGSVETSVTPDETLVGGTVLSEFTSDLVSLVADVAMNPRFPEKEVERVRADAIRDVTIARTVPQTLAQERFLATLYPNHAYGRLLPTTETVQGYTIDDVRRFHAQHYGARRAHLYVAGRFDEGAAEKAIRAAFARMPAGTAREARAPSPASRRAVHLVPRSGAVQSSLYLGLPVLHPGHPDYVKLSVANTLLGGYFSSRVTANIREAKGYTYSPYSLLAVRAGTGYWAQVADVTTAVTGASLKEIFSEIDRLRAEPPPPQELSAVQSYIAGSFLLATSDRQGLITRLRFVDLHGLPETWLEDYVKNVRAVSAADVQRVAREWLDPSRMTVVVVGDPAQVGEQVKAFGELVEGQGPRS